MTLLEPTGINVLDTILGGGLPRPSAVGLIGNMGSGKSLFAKQIAVNMLRKDFRVLYYSIDESADDLRESLVSLGPGVEEALDHLYLLYKVERGLRQADRGELISQEEVRQRMAKWLK